MAVRGAAACIVLLALSACGYKGPLTLPEEKPAAAQSTAPAAAGAQAPAGSSGR